MSTVYDEKLLDKVGLAMVPSGYTNNAADEGNAGGALGKVYSVLPIQTTSDNLVTNGTFDTDSDWSKGTGWTIANGVATHDGSASFAYLQQNNVNTGHKEGKGILTFTISGCTNFSQAGIVAQFTIGGSTTVKNFLNFGITSNGTITIDDFSNYYPTLAFWNNTGSPITIDNVSYQVITDGDFDFSRGSDATRVNSQGYIESVQVLSDELVQNGDFEDVSSIERISNGNFQTGVGWSGSASVANNQLTKTTGGLAYQEIPYNLDNKIFKIVTDVELSLASLTLYVGGTQVNLVQGINTLYVKGGIANDFIGFNNGYDVATSTGSVINNISVKEVGQNWTFDTGWSVAEVNGNLKLSSVNGINYGVYQQNILTSGKKYRVSYTISEYSSGSLGIRLGTQAVTMPSTTENGTLTYDRDWETP